MDVQAARALLGVSTTATPEQTRRAYLRLVKQHNPESDPEGFARAREAFEVLQQFQAYARFIPVAAAETAPNQTEAAPMLASLPVVPVVESRTEPLPEAPSAPHSEPVSEPVLEQPSVPPAPIEPAPWSSEEEEIDSESRALEARYAQLPYFDLDAKAKFFREEWDHPSPALFWFTVEKLSSYGPLQSLRCECLRRAVDLEMPHALTHLVRSGPQLVRDGEMASLLNADSVVERFLGARLLAWQEQDAAMLEVVAEMFSLEAIRDQIVPAAALIDLALYCVELGRPSSASSLVQVLTEHFAKFQDENQVLRGDLSIRWALLRELVGLGSTIPPRQLAKVAQALHGDSPEAINDAASDLLQSRGLAKLDETRRLLHLYAPALAKVLNLQAALAWVDPSAHRGFHLPRISPVLLIFLGLMVVRMVTAYVDTISSPPAVSSYPAPGGLQPTEFMRQFASETAIPGQARTPEAEIALLRGTTEWIARNHCVDGASRAGALMLHSAEPKLSMVEKLECARMRRILDALDGKTCRFYEPDWRSRPEQSKPMQQFLDEVSTLRLKLCSPTSTEPEP